MKSRLKSRTVKFYRSGYGVLILATGFTVVAMVYAAQPWGDNYAYRNLSGYLSLFGFMLWAVSPYLVLAFILYFCRNNSTSMTIAFIGTVIIVLAAAVILVDAFFIHLDAQGALVILFLPVYQWLAAFLLILICAVLGSLFRPSP